MFLRGSLLLFVIRNIFTYIYIFKITTAAFQVMNRLNGRVNKDGCHTIGSIKLAPKAPWRVEGILRIRPESLFI